MKSRHVEAVGFPMAFFVCSGAPYDQEVIDLWKVTVAARKKTNGRPRDRSAEAILFPALAAFPHNGRR